MLLSRRPSLSPRNLAQQYDTNSRACGHLGAPESIHCYWRRAAGTFVSVVDGIRCWSCTNELLTFPLSLTASGSKGNIPVRPGALVKLRLVRRFWLTAISNRWHRDVRKNIANYQCFHFVASSDRDLCRLNSLSLFKHSTSNEIRQLPNWYKQSFTI